MRSVTPLLLLLFLAACAPGLRVQAPAEGLVTESSATEAPIVATLDLTAVADDRVPVTVDPGAFDGGEVLFRLPRVIPGTYKVYDFGQYVDSLTAYDYAGNALPAERTDPNTWRIADATQLDRLAYYVNDTFDIERSREGVPFSPSGTNIDPDIYVLNLHGFVGYFEGMTEQPYELRVTAPAGLERAAALPLAASEVEGDAVTSVYRADRYFEITDNPMMVGDLDVATIPLDDIEVTLAVYSPSGTHTAATLKPTLEEMMVAQRAYLGDLETTDRYTVFLHLAGDGADQPVGTGALEHHTSTVVTLIDGLTPDALAGYMVDVVAHEFFHIVQPLTIHSEDIHDFDYYDPTFSKHLWFYEGQTEYFAQHFQVYEGLKDRPAFYQELAGKIDAAWGFDDTMSFTVMSERVTEEPYKSDYLNVYQKGALIGMCNDILIRAGSDGERSLLSVTHELQEKYGMARPFEDDGFIDEFEAFTYPSVGAFLRTHVEGTTPIDYADCLAPVGLTVRQIEIPSSLLFHHTPSGAFHPYLTIASDATSIEFPDGPLNSGLDALGVQGGDRLKTFNGAAYTIANANALLQASAALAPDAEVTLVVERDGAEVELSGTPGQPMGMTTLVEELPDATPEQLALRDAWLGQPTP